MKSFSFLILLLFLFSTNVFCADKSTHIHTELKEVKGKIKKKTKKLSIIREKYFKTKKEIISIDKRIGKLHGKIRQGKTEVRKIEKHIALLQGNIGYLKREIGDNRELLNAHFKTFLVTSFRKEQYVPSCRDISPSWTMCMLGKTADVFKESILKYTGKLERLQKDENWLRILVFRKKKAVSRINGQEKALIQEKKKKGYLLASLKHSKRMYVSQVYKLKKRRKYLEALLVKIVKEKLKKRYTYKKEAAKKPFYLLKRKLIFPVRRGTIIGEFGKKYDKVIGIYTKNNGIDVRVDKKESVYAVYSGCVDYVGDVPGYGGTIILNHLNKYYTIYAGMDSVDVREHDSVVAGRQLGKVTECLHFELRKRILALNPLNWLNCKNIRRKR